MGCKCFFCIGLRRSSAARGRWAGGCITGNFFPPRRKTFRALALSPAAEKEGGDAASGACVARRPSHHTSAALQRRAGQLGRRVPVTLGEGPERGREMRGARGSVLRAFFFALLSRRLASVVPAIQESTGKPRLEHHPPESASGLPKRGPRGPCRGPATATGSRGPPAPWG